MEQLVIVYDNYNYLITKRDEHLGHRAQMEAMTTASVVICPEIPSTGIY
jgi:hypothetical protein